MHRCAGSDLERHAAVIYIEDVAVRFQGAEHILRSLAVLHLIVHMKDSEAAVECIFADIVYAEIKEDTAVLASREGDIDIIEVIENDLEPADRRII